jgi:hypothetical protein
MNRPKKRALTSSPLNSNDEFESESQEDIGLPKKKVRSLGSRNHSYDILEFLQKDSQKNDDFVKLYMAKLENEREENRERLEYERRRDDLQRARQQEVEDREFALRQRMIDLEFARIEEKRLEREEKKLEKDERRVEKNV